MPFLSGIISREIRIILVDCIIGQVNKGIVECFQFVLFGGKSAKAVLVDKNTQWLHISDKDIDSQVELIVVNQEWSAQVFLNYQMLIGINRLDTLGNKNAFSLTHAFRFHNEVDF